MHMQSPREYGVWTEQGLIWLEMCQALIRLPGESPGADHEVEEAEALGIPVFYSVAEFLDAEKE
jgi:hypothetical protein